jgi:hypothetical protein
MGRTLMLSLMTAFKYGRSWVFWNVTGSLFEGNAVSNSASSFLRIFGLFTRSNRVNVAVILVVSLPAIL